MAKEDFCFTYYDGDAARDMAHMNRLERGAYTDFIIQQRNKGHLSIEDVKKFLSKDFESVWIALEWVLKKDEEEKYFIEWLENSINKSKKHSTHQSNNGELGGRPPKEFYEFKKRIEKKLPEIDLDFEISYCEKKQRECDHNEPLFYYYKHCLNFLNKINQPESEKKPTESQPKANIQKTESEKKPLGDGDVYVLGSKGKESLKEKPLETEIEKIIAPAIQKKFIQSFPKYPKDNSKDFPACLQIAYSIGDELGLTWDQVLREKQEQVLNRWGEIILFISSDKWFSKRSLHDINNEWQRLIQSINSNGTTANSISNKRSGTSTDRIAAAKKW